MITLTHIKRVNSRMKESGYTYFIAGGAPRDLKLGRPITDIDVFVKLPPNYSTSNTGELLETFNRLFGQEGEPTWLEDYLGGPQNSLGLIDYKVSFEEKCQIIFVKTSVEDFKNYVFKRFDFGLCRIGFDERLNKVKSSQFTYDYDTMQLTLYMWDSPAQLLKAVTEHYPRLKAKYPSYGFNCVKTELNPSRELDEEITRTEVEVNYDFNTQATTASLTSNPRRSQRERTTYEENAQRWFTTSLTSSSLTGSSGNSGGNSGFNF